MKLLLATLVMGLLLAACSGESTDDAVASLEGSDTEVSVGDGTVAAEVDQEEVMLAFAECMRENGIRIDDPTVDADGNVSFGRLRSAITGDVDPEAIQAAREACDGELQGIALGTRGDRDRTAEEDVFLEFAACMRDNGFDMADPDMSQAGSGGGGGVGPFGELDRTDPDFVAAIPICQDILSGTGPSGEGPPGVSGG